MDLSSCFVVLRNVTILMVINMVYNFGKNFKRYRKLAGFTQQDLAEQLHMSTDMVGRIEQGRSLPSLESLIEISKILNVPLDYFVSEESPENLIFSSIVFIERLKQLSGDDLRNVTEVLKSAFEYLNLRHDKTTDKE